MEISNFLSFFWGSFCIRLFVLYMVKVVFWSLVKISHFVKMLTSSKLDKANIPSFGQAILVLFSNSKLYSVAIFPNSCLNTDVFSSSLVVIQKAADYMCQCCLSRYCTVYKLLVILDKLHVLVTNCELLVTHINQLVNFTVKLGEDKETVLANRNYTKSPASH